jgi:hypothetical protein
MNGARLLGNVHWYDNSYDPWRAQRANAWPAESTDNACSNSVLSGCCSADQKANHSTHGSTLHLPEFAAITDRQTAQLNPQNKHSTQNHNPDQGNTVFRRLLSHELLR